MTRRRQPKPLWIRDLTLRQAIQHNIDIGRISAEATPVESAHDQDQKDLCLTILDQFQAVLDHVVVD